MNLLSNENGDLMIKAIGALLAFLSLRWVIKIFAGDDGKLDKQEFIKFVAFGFFLWAAIYIIVKEANRPSGTEHIFSEIWIFFTMSGLITVLSLDKAIDALTKLIEAIVRLRTPIIRNNEEANNTTHISVNNGSVSGIPSDATTGP